LSYLTLFLAFQVDNLDIKVMYLIDIHVDPPPPTPKASSTTKTGCHDIAEILLKVALNTKNQRSLPPLPIVFSFMLTAPIFKVFIKIQVYHQYGVGLRLDL
jgi:hypothetical protein